MSALATAPAGLRELVDTVGLAPLKPLLLELDAELAALIAAPPADGPTLGSQAHGLVGAAGGIGFVDLAERCRELELACKAQDDPSAALARVKDAARAARLAIAGLVAS